MEQSMASNDIEACIFANGVNPQGGAPNKSGAFIIGVL